MRKLHLLIGSLVLSIVVSGTWQILVKHNSKPVRNNHAIADSSTAGRDILPDILAINRVEKNYPKKNFRSGHVTKTRLENYLEKTADGYCIRLPSANTNVPTPAVMNGSVVLSGGFGSKEYYAFDAFSGKIKWAIHLDDDGPSSPAVEDGIIVFNTESCTIFACDLLTGELIWSYWLGDPLMSMPSIANGIVFTSYPATYPGNMERKNASGHSPQIIPTHVLIAFDLRTGAILWQKWIDSDIMSAPVAKGDLLYATTFSGALYTIQQKTGNILEAKAIRATSAPVFSQKNEVIVSQRGDSDKDSYLSEVVVVGYGSKKKEMYKKRADYLDKKVQTSSRLKENAKVMDAGNGFSNGAPVNSNYMAANDNIGQSNVSSLQSFQGSRGVYRQGRLYNTMGDEIICTDSDGKVNWKYSLDGDLKKEGGSMGTPPVYANGYIIVATFTGDVLLIDENDGKLVKNYKIKDPVRYQPVVENGWIYVTTSNSKMYAINTGNKAITGWPMWGANAARTNVTD